MWEKRYSMFYNDITPDDIWAVWTDINNWPRWQSDVEYCQLEGEFRVGSYFMLKPKGVPAVKIAITEVDEKKSFTDCTKFFGAKMVSTHSMEIKDGGVVLSHKLIVTGPLRWLWIKLVAQNVADTISEEMDALVAIARGHK